MDYKFKKGVDKISNNGHGFNFEKKSKNGMLKYWQCDQRNKLKCKARCHTDKNNNISKVCGVHNHPANTERI